MSISVRARARVLAEVPVPPPPSHVRSVDHFGFIPADDGLAAGLAGSNLYRLLPVCYVACSPSWPTGSPRGYAAGAGVWARPADRQNGMAGLRGKSDA